MKARILSILFPVFLRRWVFQGWDVLMTLLVLYVAAPVIKLLTRLGVRKPNKAPRVVFGPAPLVNSIYHSRALRLVGMDSTTAVRSFSTWITSNTDFDIIINPPVEGSPFFRRWYLRLLHKYVVFTRLLWTRDVFFYYFDDFYLLWGGPLKWREHRMLRGMGKRIIAMPFGGDITYIPDMPDLVLKHAMVKQYPLFGTVQYMDTVRRQIRHFTQYADAIIAGNAWDPYMLPRVDYIVPSPFCINERLWEPTYGPARKVGEPFRVFHAPNHRLMNGTQFLLEAVEQLRQEGLNVEIVLLERVPNPELRRIMAGCHVVAERFLMGWHAMVGLEGMASGKPVLSYNRPEITRLYTLYSFGAECPVVDTPIERIGENLRWLYNHPEECERIGRASRAYVERYYALEPFGGYLKGIAEAVWVGKRFDDEAYWRTRKHSDSS